MLLSVLSFFVSHEVEKYFKQKGYPPRNRFLEIFSYAYEDFLTERVLRYPKYEQKVYSSVGDHYTFVFKNDRGKVLYSAGEEPAVKEGIEKLINNGFLEVEKKEEFIVGTQYYEANSIIFKIKDPFAKDIRIFMKKYDYLNESEDISEEK